MSAWTPSDWTEWADPEDVEPWTPERLAAASEVKLTPLVSAGVWDPTKHPREPGGTPLGGQFKSIGIPSDVDLINGTTGPNTLALDNEMTDSMNGEDLADYGAVTKQATMKKVAARLKNDPAWNAETVRSEMGWVRTPDENTQIFSTDLDENTTAQLIQAWSFTSSDSARTSLLVQSAAADEFGAPFDLHEITHAHITPGSDPTGSKLHAADNVEFAVNADRKNPELMGSLRAFVRAQYAETQSMLTGLGIAPDADLTLYRGMAFPNRPSPFPPGFSRSRISMNPMSSWTTDPVTALSFSGRGIRGVVVTAAVPRGRILGTPLSGDGSLNEREVVVAGGDLDDALVWSHDGPESLFVTIPEYRAGLIEWVREHRR